MYRALVTYTADVGPVLYMYIVGRYSTLVGLKPNNQLITVIA